MPDIALSDLLRKMIEQGGSDLHITTNSAPMVRVHGTLRPLDYAELTPAETKQLAYSVLTDAQKHRFEETLELDFSFGIKGLSRFRANIFNQRGAVGAVFRAIPYEIRSFDQLGLPPVVESLCAKPRGRIPETGHLTFGTLHTNSAFSTINRVIDIFPAHQQSQIRAQLSLVIEGILCQSLLPKASGGGRAMAMEVLVPNAAIRNLIREDKVHQIYSMMQTGQAKYGMQTFNQSLATLYFKKAITLQTALSRSSNPDELQEMISRGAGAIMPQGAPPAGAAQRPRPA